MNRMPPSRRDLVNDHTNGRHRAPIGKPHIFCDACDIECPKCGDALRHRNSCHLAGGAPQGNLEAYKERMGL